VIVLDVVQGSHEWKLARLGIPTSSQFNLIMAPKTKKLSASAPKYMCQLLAERMTGLPTESYESEFMTRGSALEAAAATAYELEMDCDTTKVGFVMDDSRRWGCSPDRLVGEDGLLEIKCPTPPVHISAMLGLETDNHVIQCQGQLWVTGRKWVDLMHYSPDLPPVIYRVERDEEYIAELAYAVQRFCQSLETAWESLQVGPQRVVSAKDADTDGMDPTAPAESFA
jgi:hypothetical protein